MRVATLRIENFRGVRDGVIPFANHTVFVGANNAGKTTILEALALLFGRDRMVRPLTEHDFFGSDPQPQDRIRIIATLIGFEGNDPAQHLDWFRDGRGIPKWWDSSQNALYPQRTNDQWHLACQVAFTARFDRQNLEVETVRHFYDDDNVGDIFTDDAAIPFPAQLVRELGLFLVPASRTWDKTLSFGSELFRRVLATGGGQPSASVIQERDRLRHPQPSLEADQNLAPIVSRLNDELQGFFNGSTRLHLRVTATDSDGLLEAVIPHYSHEGVAFPLPARRHGSGLLSLQHLLLLLQFGRMRNENQDGFWMALEEPELHVPPAMQRRLVSRIQSLSTQTFVTTHSPMVAALSDPLGIRLVRNDGGTLTTVPLLQATLPAGTPNSIRKLFQLNRVETISALMHEYVLVPEGRMDFELLGLLSKAVDLHQAWDSPQNCSFGSHVGIVPTHDSAVIPTVSVFEDIHPKVSVLVDGDAAGLGYAQSLLAAAQPNSGIIFQWPTDWTIEDAIGWVVDGNPATCLEAMALDTVPATTANLVARLKSTNRDAGGLKTDISSYEAVVGAIGSTQACRQRAIQLLEGIVAIQKGQINSRFTPDPISGSIWIFQP